MNSIDNHKNKLKQNKLSKKKKKKIEKHKQTKNKKNLYSFLKLKKMI